MAMELLEPTVTDRAPTIAGARRLSDVRGKRLGFVDNSKCNADLFIQRVCCATCGSIASRVPGPVIRKAAPKDRLSDSDLRDLAQCDAVVQCFGDCGTSTSISVADAVEIERRGIPTVTVFSTAFAAPRANRRPGGGMADLPLVRIPHPMHTAQRNVVDERADAVVDALVERLTQHGDDTVEAGVADRFDGANDDDQEMLFARGWTDGLPVVIPTAEKVAAMVAASGRDAAEQVGPIPPRWRQATIEKIAINAVLAGCRPEYFPVVLAAIDALLDNDCQLYGIQTATNTTAPLLIVNGPIVDELDINARGNVFGQGARANATIGRAVQLVLRNIGGDIAGETDMATHGQAGKFSACIAEAEADSPWSPFHVDAGFARGRQHGHRDRRVGAAKYLHLWLRDGPGHSRALRRRDAGARPQQHHLSDRAAVRRQPRTCGDNGARRHRQEGHPQRRIRARAHSLDALCQAQRAWASSSPRALVRGSRRSKPYRGRGSAGGYQHCRRRRRGHPLAVRADRVQLSAGDAPDRDRTEDATKRALRKSGKKRNAARPKAAAPVRGCN